METVSDTELLNAFFIFIVLIFSTATAALVSRRIKHFIMTTFQVQRLLETKCDHINAPTKQHNMAEKLEAILQLEQSDGFASSMTTLGRSLQKTNPRSRVFSSLDLALVSSDESKKPTSHVKENIDAFETPKHRYLESELRRLCQPQNATSLPDQLDLLRLLKFENQLPPPQFDTTKVARMVIEELRISLLDKEDTSRALAFFQLAAIGSSQSVFDNPIYYHETFCNLLEDQVENHSLFKHSSSVDGLQMLLIDLLVCFTWCHWNYEDFFNLKGSERFPSQIENDNYPYPAQKMLEYFRRSALEPFVMSHLSVFRLLCSVWLESSFLLPLASLKLSLVFRTCAQQTGCYEHRQLLPLIEQSILAAENPSVKPFFYDLVAEIIEPHVDCCIDTHDVFYPHSHLQGLILQGMWIGQSSEIRAKANHVAHILGRAYPEVKLWTEPCEARTSNTQHMHDYSNTPGSWTK